MKPQEPVDLGQRDLFQARLDQIFDMGHEKVVLAEAINWDFLNDKCAGAYTDRPGHPPLPVRLIAGLNCRQTCPRIGE